MSMGALRVGVVYPSQGDGIAALISETLQELGHEAIGFLHDAKWPDHLDVVLACGFAPSLVPLAKQLLECSAAKRPLFILWQIEQLPNPGLPEWLRYTVGVIRSAAERVAFRRQVSGGWQPDPRLRWLTTKAYRFRYYGDLYWLQRWRILSVLAVSSCWTTEFLRRRGFDPITAHLGGQPGNPEWGAELKLERDIPVVWLGTIATERRRRLLTRLRTELKSRGVDILVIDGVENPRVYGEERTVLLNRTRIALNLLREKWDDNSNRFFLAALNRALVVTEPTFPHVPLLSGVHLVEAPIERMAETICHYLSHDEERRQIVEQAYQLATTELTTRNAIGQIMERVIAVRQDCLRK